LRSPISPNDGDDADEQRAEARLGAAVGNYRLTEVVGRGGMGTVYAAEHVYIGKRVAMKILHERYAKNAEAVGRFLREARAATAINHANIVDVMDFGPAADGEVYLVMEFLDGQNLEDVLDAEAPLPLHRALGIGHQIASALAAAHEKDIVHSDLKPANVMLIQRPGRRELIRAEGLAADGQPRFVIEKEGSFDFVKVLDFGIAQMHDPDAPPADSPHVFGTPEYMSPEAARGDRITPQSDVYSLGILLYEMLTGEVPFVAVSPVGVLRKHLTDPPVPPRQRAPEAEITEAAERLILRALAKDPADRVGSMDELRAELAGCYGSVAFRRDAHRLPAAIAQGLAPRKRRLTQEIDEWITREKAALAARVEGEADKPPEEDVEPLLLTDRKPI
jgi:eukaryotic-like serine/threonine-protein kinase